jgi:hypothetical protein
MAYSPIASIAPQYASYANWWLKAYEQGTTTPLAMATDSTGATTLAAAELDSNGFITTDGTAKFIPHFDQAYDLLLFPTEIEATKNITTNAIELADNINPSTGSASLLVSNNDTTGGYLNGKLAAGIGIKFTEGNDGGNETLTLTVRENGSDVASSASLVVGTGDYFNVTGTTNIIAIGTKGVGTQITLRFDDVLTIVHDATNLVLPGGQDIVTEQNAHATFREYASGWRLINYEGKGQAVAKHFRVGNTYLYNGDNDAAYVGGGIVFPVAPPIPADTWGTVGPAGSGADITIPYFDNLPSNARALLFNFELSYTAAASTIFNLFAVSGDVVSPTASSSYNQLIQHIVIAPPTTNIITYPSLILPLGSDQTFQMYWQESTAQAFSGILEPRGFIVD